jgi:hypothetical protein
MARREPAPGRGVEGENYRGSKIEHAFFMHLISPRRNRSIFNRMTFM